MASALVTDQLLWRCELEWPKLDKWQLSCVLMSTKSPHWQQAYCRGSGKGAQLAQLPVQEVLVNNTFKIRYYRQIKLPFEAALRFQLKKKPKG